MTSNASSAVAPLSDPISVVHLSESNEVHLMIPPGQTAEQALSTLVGLLGQNDVAVRRDTVWLLWKLTQESVHKDALRSLGVLDPLIECLVSESFETRRYALRTLCNLSFDPDNNSNLRLIGGIGPVIDCLTPPEAGTGEDVETIRAALRALCNISRNEDNREEIRLLGGLIPIIEAVKTADVKTKRDALRTLCNLSSHESNKQELRPLGGLPPIVSALSFNDRQIRRYALACIINISSDSVNETELGALGALGPILDMATDPEEPEAAFAMRALCNLSHAQSNKVALGALQVIPRLFALLHHSDPVASTSDSGRTSRADSTPEPASEDELLAYALATLMHVLSEPELRTESLQSVTSRPGALHLFAKHFGPPGSTSLSTRYAIGSLAVLLEHEEAAKHWQDNTISVPDQDPTPGQDLLLGLAQAHIAGTGPSKKIGRYTIRALWALAEKATSFPEAPGLGPVLAEGLDSADLDTRFYASKLLATVIDPEKPCKALQEADLPSPYNEVTSDDTSEAAAALALLKEAIQQEEEEKEEEKAAAAAEAAAARTAAAEAARESIASRASRRKVSSAGGTRSEQGLPPGTPASTLIGLLEGNAPAIMTPSQDDVRLQLVSAHERIEALQRQLDERSSPTTPARPLSVTSGSNGANDTIEELQESLNLANDRIAILNAEVERLNALSPPPAQGTFVASNEAHDESSPSVPRGDLEAAEARIKVLTEEMEAMQAASTPAPSSDDSDMVTRAEFETAVEEARAKGRASASEELEEAGERIRLLNQELKIMASKSPSPRPPATSPRYAMDEVEAMIEEARSKARADVATSESTAGARLASEATQKLADSQARVAELEKELDAAHKALEAARVDNETVQALSEAEDRIAVLNQEVQMLSKVRTPSPVAPVAGPAPINGVPHDEHDEAVKKAHQEGLKAGETVARAKYDAAVADAVAAAKAQGSDLSKEEAMKTISELEGAIESANDRAKLLQHELDTVTSLSDRRIAGLEGQTISLINQLEEKEAKLEEVEAKLAALASHPVTPEPSSNPAHVGTAEDRHTRLVTSHIAAQATLREELETARKALEEEKAKINSQKEYGGATADRVKALEAELEASSASADKLMQSLQDENQKLDEKLAAKTAQVSELEAKLKKQADAMEADKQAALADVQLSAAQTVLEKERAAKTAALEAEVEREKAKESMFEVENAQKESAAIGTAAADRVKALEEEIAAVQKETADALAEADAKVAAAVAAVDEAKADVAKAEASRRAAEDHAAEMEEDLKKVNESKGSDRSASDEKIALLTAEVSRLTDSGNKSEDEAQAMRAELAAIKAVLAEERSTASRAEGEQAAAEVQKMASKLEEVRKEAKEAHDRQLAAEERAALLMKEVESITAQSTAEVETLQKQVLYLSSAADKASLEASAAALAAEAVGGEAQDAKAKAEALAKARAASEAAAESAAASASALEAALEKAKNETAAANERVTVLTKELAAQESWSNEQLQQAEKRVTSLQEELHQTQADLEKAQGQLRSRAGLAQSASMASMISGASPDASRELAAASERIRALQEELDVQGNFITEETNRLATQAEQARSQAEESKQALEAERTEAQSREEALTEQLEAAQSESAKLKLLLDRARAQRKPEEDLLVAKIEAVSKDKSASKVSGTTEFQDIPAPPRGTSQNLRGAAEDSEEPLSAGELSKVKKTALAVIAKGSKVKNETERTSRSALMAALAGPLSLHSEAREMVLKETNLLPVLLDIHASEKRDRETMHRVLTLLAVLTDVEGVAEKIGGEGGTAQLASDLHAEDLERRALGAAIVKNLSASPANDAALVKAGAVTVLLSMLSEEDPELRTHSAATLKNMCIGQVGRDTVIEKGGISAVVDTAVKEADYEVKSDLLRVLALLTAAKDGRTQMRNNGPGMTLLLESTRAQGTKASAWRRCAAAALVNVSSNGQGKKIVQLGGGVEALLGLLTDSEGETRLLAMRGLSNLCTSGGVAEAIVVIPRERTIPTSSGPAQHAYGLSLLVQCAMGSRAGEKSLTAMRRYGMKAIARLAAQPVATEALRECGAVGAALIALPSRDPETVEEACKALTLIWNDDVSSVVGNDSAGITALVKVLASATGGHARGTQVLCLSILAKVLPVEAAGKAATKAGGVNVLLAWLKSDLDEDELALACLTELVKLPSTKSAIAKEDEASKIKTIVNLFAAAQEAQSPSLGDWLNVLFHLSSHPQLRGAIREAGGLGPVVKCAGATDLSVRRGGLTALYGLSLDDMNEKELVKLGAVSVIVRGVESSDRETRRRALSTLCNVSIAVESKTAIRDCGGVSSVLRVLATSLDDGEKSPEGETTKVIRDCTRVIRNVSFDHASQEELLKGGAVQWMIAVCEAVEDVTTVKYAVRTLGVLSTTLPGRKDIMSRNGLAVLLSLLASSTDESTRRGAVGALINLSINNKAKRTIKELGGIPLLVGMLGKGVETESEADENTIVFTLRALGNLGLNADNEKEILESGGMPLIVSFLDSKTEMIVLTATGALANLTTNLRSKVLLRTTGGIPGIVRGADSNHIELRKASLQVLANVAMNVDNQLAIREARGVKPILFALSSGEAAVRRSACTALAALVNNASVRREMNSNQSMRPLVGTLTSDDDETRRAGIVVLKSLRLDPAVRPLVDSMAERFGGVPEGDEVRRPESRGGLEALEDDEAEEEAAAAEEMDAIPTPTNAKATLASTKSVRSIRKSVVVRRRSSAALAE